LQALRKLRAETLRQPEIADLALVLEVDHGLHGVLDGRVGVHAVLVVEIDAIRLQALQAGGTGLLHVFWIAVNDHDAVLEPIAKLGGQEDLVSATRRLKPLADQALVGERSVDVARVPERDAHVGRLGQDLQGLIIVVASEGCIAEGHSHAS